MSEVNENAPKRAAKAAFSGKKVIIGLCAAAAVLAGGYTLLCAQVKEDTVLPKTVVNAVELGGMTKEEAVKAVEENFHATLDDAELKVVVDGKEYPVQVGSTLTMDSAAAVEEATEANRGFFLTRGAALVKAAAMGSDAFCPPVVSDTDLLAENIRSSGLMDINTTVQSTYQVNKETGDLDLVKGVTGHSVDEAALTDAIHAAVAAGDYETVIECPTITGTVEDLNWKKITKKICKDPADATLKLSENRRDYEMVKSVTGVKFDTDSAKQDFAAAAEGSTVTVKLTYTEPEITTADLEANLFQDKLSSYDTRVGGSDGRKSNVRLAAEKVNGIILLPGDSLSYNNTLGQRTAENGFFPAPAYFNGEVVQEYGGGICQVSSTLYAATLYANLQIDERHNHTFASSYIGLGMDATVSWGGPDFQFTNNKKYPIKLVAGMWNGYATVQILGTKTDDIKVEIRSETLETKGYPTETKKDATLEEGKTIIEQHGMDGYKVQTYRILKDGDGKVISEEKESYSSYTPEKEIVVVGTKKKAPAKDKNKDKTNTAKPAAPTTPAANANATPAGQ